VCYDRVKLELTQPEVAKKMGFENLYRYASCTTSKPGKIEALLGAEVLQLTRILKYSNF
jgi:hypothetical protein